MDKILFGAGKIGRALKKTIHGIVYYCDNSLFGQEIDGIKVLSFEELKSVLGEREYEVIISVLDEVASNEISNLLESNGISYKKITELDELKYVEELDYWKNCFDEEANYFNNNFYSRLMLSIAGEKDDIFLKDKIVADFGCGPRGSLTWMKAPRVKIGIDVLATEDTKNFDKNIVKQDMIYVTSTEQCIPMPDSSVECLITINALDHVRDLDVMCSELLRILKKGGIFLGSFNLFEKATECEPQTLTEDILKQNLLDYISIEKYHIAKKDDEDTYKYMNMGEYLDEVNGEFPCVLWVRGVKK